MTVWTRFKRQAAYKARFINYIYKPIRKIYLNCMFPNAYYFGGWRTLS